MSLVSVYISRVRNPSIWLSSKNAADTSVMAISSGKGQEFRLLALKLKVDQNLGILEMLLLKEFLAIFSIDSLILILRFFILSCRCFLWLMHPVEIINYSRYANIMTV